MEDGRAYYNEIDPYAADWLRNLIAAGLIMPGDVDTRSIVDVRPADVAGYERCHWFAGIGVWDYALGLAGWPAGRPVWTGSCPCQPFSSAGRRAGFDDERHLWPVWFDLIRECRPDTILGEQVEAAVRLGWLDAVFADLEGQDYACGAVVLGAHSVGAPHIRQRLWFVADAGHGTLGESGQLPASAKADEAAAPGEGRHERARAAAHSGADVFVAEPHRERLDGEPARLRWANATGRDAPDHAEAAGGREVGALADAECGERGPGRVQRSGGTRSAAGELTTAEEFTGDGLSGFWSDFIWLPCRDGKARPTQPGLQPLVDGAAFKLGSGSAFEGRSRVGMLKCAGNAINAETAVEFIAAALASLPTPTPSPAAGLTVE